MKNPRYLFLIGIVLCILAFLGAIDANAQEERETETMTICLDLFDAQAMVDIQIYGKPKDISAMKKSMSEQGLCRPVKVVLHGEINSTSMMKYYQKKGNKVIGVVYIQVTNTQGEYLIVHREIK